MANKGGGAEAELRHLRVTLDDELSQLEALCRLGGLAAEGMHGLHEDPAATAFFFYFSLLRTEVETLRQSCGGARSPDEAAVKSGSDECVPGLRCRFIRATLSKSLQHLVIPAKAGIQLRRRQTHRR